VKKIIPLYGRVLVRRVEAEEVTKGGLYIPDQAREAPLEGVVVAIGRGWIEDGKRRALEVKVGDRVILSNRYAGTGSDIILNGESVLMLREDEILGIIKEVKG